MDFRNINLKDRTIRRVFHRCLIVTSGVLWLTLSIILTATSDSRHSEDMLGWALFFGILFYVTGRILYWSFYWILQGFQQKPVKPRREFFEDTWNRILTFFNKLYNAYGFRLSLRILVLSIIILYTALCSINAFIYDDESSLKLALLGYVALSIFIIYCGIADRKAASKKNEEHDLEYDEYDYAELYMLRISRIVVGDRAFESGTVLLEDTILSDNLEETKQECLQRARHFLNIRHIGEWQECDAGFEIKDGNIHVMLITDISLIPAPDVEGPTETTPIRV